MNKQEQIKQLKQTILETKKELRKLGVNMH